MTGKSDVEKDENEIEPDEEEITSFDPKKIVKIKEQLRLCQSERQQYLDGWQRARADYANKVREHDEYNASLSRTLKEDFFYDILPVVDSFMLASSADTWKDVSESWRKGVEHIYAQLMGILEHHGLSSFESTGEVFDEARHHSLGTIPVSDKKDDGRVMETLQQGFKSGEKILRPAQVKVGVYSQEK